METPIVYYVDIVVGVVGLEPTTSASQTQRANPTAPHPDGVFFGADGESRTLVLSLENLYTNRCTTPAFW